MKVVGHIESLWRYPVKSMRGEELDETRLAFGGVEGDRRCAIWYSRAAPDFPYFTARQDSRLLQHRALYRPKSDAGDQGIWIETPEGERFHIGDTNLLAHLSRNLPEGESLALLSADHALADCHPLSLFSIQTVDQLSAESGLTVDKRRFRANIYLNLPSAAGFTEDSFVGQKLVLGSEATVSVIERDPRCKMITLDPDSSAANPDIIRNLARQHETKAGVYATVLVEGTVRKGDPVALLS